MSQALSLKQVVSVWRAVYNRCFAKHLSRVRFLIEDVALEVKPNVEGRAVIMIAQLGVGFDVKVVYRTIFIADAITGVDLTVSQTEDLIGELRVAARRTVLGHMPGLDYQQYQDVGFMVVPDIESLTGEFRIEQILTNVLTHMRLLNQS